MATRISRSVGQPTSAVIRRTCRFFPSVSTISIHVSGIDFLTRMGGSRGGTSGLGSRIRTLAGLVRYPCSMDPVRAGMFKPGFRRAVLQGSVVRQQHEAFAVLVQAAGGVDPFHLDVVRQIGAAARELALDSVGFVEEDVAQDSGHLAGDTPHTTLRSDPFRIAAITGTRDLPF
jgi:hypothetical protein